MGASSLAWNMQHNVGHHPNANRKGEYYNEDYDPDSRSGYPHVRLSPNHPWKPLYRYQHLYIWILFLGVGYKWLYGDFRSLYYRKYQSFEYCNISRGEVLLSLSTKAMFFCYALGAPSFAFGFLRAWAIFSLFLAAQSYVFILMFGVNHLTEDAVFPNEEFLERDWAKLQVMTACNFATHSKMWTWISGGLNHQIEHHLFPAISHTYLPYIQPIVKQTCKEFNVPYHSYPDYWSAICSYYNHIKSLGNPEDKQKAS